MSRRKRSHSRKTGDGYNYIYFTIFFLITAWLLSSIYFRKNPSALLKDTYLRISGQTEQVSKTAEEWNALLETKNQEILSLQDSIKALYDANPYQMATVETDQSSLNLRSDPSLSSEIVVKIPNGNQVSVMYYDDQSLMLEGKSGKWVKVKYAEFEGWVWSNYLK